MPDIITQTLPCPAPVLGFMIGRNGHAIKAMQDASGASFLINDNDRVADYNIQYVYMRLKGTPAQVDRAKRLVMLRMYRLAEAAPRARDAGASRPGPAHYLGARDAR